MLDDQGYVWFDACFHPREPSTANDVKKHGIISWIDEDSWKTILNSIFIFFLQILFYFASIFLPAFFPFFGFAAEREDAICITLVVGIFGFWWVQGKKAREKMSDCVRQHQIDTACREAGIHYLIHHIRDKFCLMDQAIEDQIASAKQEMEPFAELRRNKTNKQNIKDLCKKARRKTMENLCVSFSDICEDISQFFKKIIPNEDIIGCCIRIGQTSDGLFGYATFGRSRGLNDHRHRDSEKLLPNEGIAKILSDGQLSAKEKCVILVPSIKKASEAGNWKVGPNDKDDMIQSTMIAPVNSKRAIAPGLDEGSEEEYTIHANVSMDGMLYLTSKKTGENCPFYVDHVDILAAIADTLGCLVFRINNKCSTMVDIYK